MRINVKLVLAAVLLLIAYIPTMMWLVDRWTYEESYYSHGFLIPLISIFIAWQRRDALKKSVARGSMAGLWIIIGSLAAHVIAAFLKVYFVSAMSLVTAIYGFVVFFFGLKTARALTFPIFFLFAMVPLPFVVIQELTVKMKLFAAQCATWVLNHIGFPSVRDGSIIKMPSSYIAVEAPCSGLRSLISLLTLGLLFAYAIKISYPRKAVLFLSSVPIAIGTNVVRLVLLATVNDLYGGKVAMGFFHDMTGYLVFALAFGALYGVSRALEIKR